MLLLENNTLVISESPAERSTYTVSFLQNCKQQSNVFCGSFECVHFAGLSVWSHQWHHPFQAREHGIQVPDLQQREAEVL